MNEDARSSNGNPIDKKLYFPGIHNKRSSLSGKLHSRRLKRKNKQNFNNEQQLAPIEEKNEEIGKKEDIDGGDADELENMGATTHDLRRRKTQEFENEFN